MGERNVGVVGCSIVGKIEKWIGVYEQLRKREEELKEQIRKIGLLLEEARKARYLIDTEKMQQQKRDYEDELKTTREKRVRLEWLATSKIKRGEWNPEILKEYEFVRDLLLLNRIREEQTKEVCRNCEDCKLIRVEMLPDGREVPLEVAKPEKACSLPYMPYYYIRDIWETKKQLQTNIRPLGPLTPEQRMELEKWISQRLTLHKNLLNSFIEEKRVIIPSRKLLYRGCTRKLPKILPVREKGIEEDWHPKAADHFPQDITAEINEDGCYARVYLSTKHGDSESE